MPSEPMKNSRHPCRLPFDNGALLPGLSDPIVHDLYYRLGIRTLDDLETLARSHMLRTRPGVGVTADELLTAIQRLRDEQSAE